MLCYHIFSTLSFRAAGTAVADEGLGGGRRWEQARRDGQAGRNVRLLLGVITAHLILTRKHTHECQSHGFLHTARETAVTRI